MPSPSPTSTTFARYPRWAAWLVLALAAALVLAGAMQPRGWGSGKPDAAFPDSHLYRNIEARVVHGEGYYAAAAAEHRAHGYPTWPPVVIREPTEAFVLDALGNDMVRWAALLAVTVAALEAARRALARTALSSRQQLWSLALATSGLAAAVTPQVVYLHEVWAAPLIALGVALRRPERWAGSVCAIFAACLFRETALPVLAVMAAFALYERRWREAAGWISAGALFCGLFALHLWLAARQHLPGDVVSPGWVRASGLPFIIATARENALLVLAPPLAITAFLAAALLGFLGCRDGWLARCGVVFALYLALFCVIGRMDNDYWGLLYTPLAPLGVALAPTAIRDLLRRAVGRAASGPAPSPQTVESLQPGR